MNIALEHVSIDKMRIIYLEPKNHLVRSGKGLISSLGFKVKARLKKYKKTRYTIGNFSKKDFSKIISEFDKLSYKSYESRRPKHEPTDSYFYPAR